MTVTPVPPSDPTPTRPPARRTWAVKFGEAVRGVRLGTRGQSSFRVHGFFAALAVGAATVFGCDTTEWALIALCIGGVVTAELFNSSLETLFHGLDSDTKNRLVGVLDIAAGAVLVAAGTAVVAGALVFVPRLVRFAGG